MAEHILDAINYISKGKSTRLKIGSRAIPHRLKKSEREQLERALGKGFLELKKFDRINVVNIFEKFCDALGKHILIVEERSGTFLLRHRPPIMLQQSSKISIHPVEGNLEWSYLSFSSRKDARTECMEVCRIFNVLG